MENIILAGGDGRKGTLDRSGIRANAPDASGINCLRGKKLQ